MNPIPSPLRVPGTLPPGGGVVDNTSTKNECNRLIQEAQKYAEKDQLDLAYSRLMSASRIAPDAALKGQVQNALRGLEDKLDGWLKRADENFATGKYPEAIKTYRLVSNMSQLKIATSAAQKLAEAEKDPKMLAELREQRAMAAYPAVRSLLNSAGGPAAKTAETQPALEAPGAADAEADAAKALKLGGPQRVRLYESLGTLSKLYAETKVGAWAAALKEKLEADKGFASSVESQKGEDAARQDYQLGVMYRTSQPAKAAEAFKKVVDKYPTSPWAQKAKEELKKLGGVAAH